MTKNVRSDGRVARLTVAWMCDNGGTTEETPASALTDRGHGRTEKEFDVNNGTERRLIALEYLNRVADDLRRVASLRVTYMQNARTHGATHQDIATALGVTESAVRAMLQRHGAE